MEEKMIDAALVLEGGGMRGVYTAGILDFFLDKEMMFSNCYGVSAGACHACSYISKQKGRAYHVQTNYLGDKRYISLYNLVFTGDLFGAEFCYNIIPNELDIFDYESFSNYKGNFYAVVTNIETGQAEYKKVTDLKKDIEIIRASASLPWVARIVKIGEKKYFDGGIADSIPIEKAMADGNKKIVVILTRDETFVKTADKTANYAKVVYHKYPKLAEAMKARHVHYNHSLKIVKEEEMKGNVFIFQPEERVEVSRLDKNKASLEKLYRQGYRDAKAHYRKLCEFLEIPYQ